MQGGNMEKGLEGPGIAPRIVEVMYFKGFPKQATQQPDMGLPQQWEAQWQEFLRMLQPSHLGQGIPQPTDAVPWDDAKSFLSAFEQVAEACRWPREDWVGRLVPALRGGVEQYICQLEPMDRLDYQKVKGAILKSDIVRMELKRQHFRQCSYQELEGPRRAYDQLQELCRQWLKPDRHSKEQILELIIQEQLLATLPPEVQSWLRECGPQNCIEMVALAEDFLMGHRRPRMWDRQVPIPEMNASSLEAERLPRQQCGGVIHQGNLIANEVTPSRNSSVDLRPKEPQTAEVGLSTEPVAVKEEFNLDQKATPWEFMQESSGGSNNTSGLSVVPFESTSHLDQQRATFASSPEPAESILSTFLGGRFPSEIKTEDTEDSDMDNSYEPFPEKFPDADSLDLETDPLSSGRMLPPNAEHRTSPRRRRKTLKKKGVISEPKEINSEPHKDFTEVLSLHPAVNEPDPVSRLRPRKPEEPEAPPLRRGIKTLRVVLTKLANTRSGKVHRCTECGYKSNWLSVLVNHMRVHTKERPYTCQGCKKNFRYSSSLRKHQKYVCSQDWLAAGDSLAEQTYGDGEASRRITSSLQENINPETSSRGPTVEPTELLSKKTHPCSKCEYRAESLTDLIKHLRIHIGEKSYKCHTCGKVFRSPSSFAKHWQTHKDTSSHLVPNSSSFDTATPAVAECDVTLSDDEELINVLAKKSAGKSGRPAAPKGKVSKTKAHQMVQQRKRRATETLKNAEGSKKSRYDTLEKKHKCPDCPHRAYYLSDLLRHQRVHTREKPYKCPDCGKSFTQKSAVTNHQKTCQIQGNKKPEEKIKKHNGKKKYTCSRCGHKTYKLSTLLVHLRTHLGEKPFKCQDCGQSFTQSSNLSRHRRLHKAPENTGSQETSPSNLSENTAGNEVLPLIKVKEEELELEITPEGDQIPAVAPRDTSAIATLSQRWRYNREEKEIVPEGGFKLVEPKKEKDDEELGKPEEPLKDETTEACNKPSELQKEAEAEKLAEKLRDELVKKEVTVRAMLEKFAYCKGRETDPGKTESETTPAVQEGEKPPSKEATGGEDPLQEDAKKNIIMPILCDQCGEGFSKDSELVRHQLSHHWE
nr:zinc finger protein 197-like isoform X2 [Pogona vitticeps]